MIDGTPLALGAVLGVALAVAVEGSADQRYVVLRNPRDPDHRAVVVPAAPAGFTRVFVLGRGKRVPRTLALGNFVVRAKAPRDLSAEARVALAKVKKRIGRSVTGVWMMDSAALGDNLKGKGWGGIVYRWLAREAARHGKVLVSDACRANKEDQATSSEAALVWQRLAAEMPSAWFEDVGGPCYVVWGGRGPGSAARQHGEPSDKELRRRARDYLGSGLCGDEVFYHVAPVSRMAAIARDGLLPGGQAPATFADFGFYSKGKVFLASGIDAANTWRTIIEEGQKAGKPDTVLLRVSPDFGLDRIVRHDWQGANHHECSFYIGKPIPPEMLQWLKAPQWQERTAEGPWRALSAWRPPRGTRATLRDGRAD